MSVLVGRAIRSGRARGVALVSTEPISFLGGIDPETGRVTEPGHPLLGQSISGTVLVFPRGKGSTVGSFVIYRMARSGTAPVAMVLAECEPIVAIGAIMADLPVVDRIDIARIRTGDTITISDNEVSIG
ncbi:MAG: DUF126 domain-containing protein [Anaerolineae bacterium]